MRRHTTPDTDEDGEDFFAPRDRGEPRGLPGDDAPPEETTAPRDPEPRAFEVVHSKNAPILDLSGRWERLNPRLIDESATPTWVRLEMATHLRPEDWNAGFLSVHERELPPGLFADLREMVPQALLRDLHRPVREFYVTPEEIEGTAVLGRWKHGREELARALEREPPPIIESTIIDVIETQAHQRRLREEPWQPMFPDDAPRREIASEPPSGDDYDEP